MSCAVAFTFVLTSFIYPGQNLVVMEYEIKCAAAISGSDIDHTMLVLPTEDEEAKAYRKEGDHSQFVTWRNFLLENGCDIDTLPQNNTGNRVITGISRALS